MADEPFITLAEAARIVFPGGDVDAEGLKRLARKGRLRVYRVGKKYFTTVRDVREMVQASAVIKYEPRPAPRMPPDLDLASAALDATLATLAKLSKVKKPK